jgi:hypothetical protein
MEKADYASMASSLNLTEEDFASLGIEIKNTKSDAKRLQKVLNEFELSQGVENIDRDMEGLVVSTRDAAEEL